MSDVMSIAASGMNDSTLRLSNAASNIANALSVSPLPASGEAYRGFQPQDVVTLSSAAGGIGSGVTSVLRARSPAYSATTGPDSAVAGASGLVATPNTDPVMDVIAAKQAQVSYGAEATIVRTGNEMQKRLLDTLS